jgi:2-polyprenyl-3-methyl-5-hydroxy-6-metoxy-1,4-benzoquinol methylase
VVSNFNQTYKSLALGSGGGRESDTATLEEKKRKIIDMYGEWTDHNIHLGGDVYTIAEDWQSEKLRRVVQIVSDVSGGSLQDLRILDLGCLEGQYAIEFALHGAHSTGIEGRTANIKKARFVQETLGIQNLAHQSGRCS